MSKAALALLGIALVISLGHWLSMRAAGYADLRLLPAHSRRHVQWLRVNSAHIQLSCAGLAAAAACVQVALSVR